jgi:hypothetical protein
MGLPADKSPAEARVLGGSGRRRVMVDWLSMEIRKFNEGRIDRNNIMLEQIMRAIQGRQKNAEIKVRIKERLLATGAHLPALISFTMRLIQFV